MYITALYKIFLLFLLNFIYKKIFHNSLSQKYIKMEKDHDDNNNIKENSIQSAFRKSLNDMTPE